MAKVRKTRGIGIKPKVVDLGVREEVWTDGKIHSVRAYAGVDRKLWIRFSKPFGFGIGKRIFCKGSGFRKVA